MAPLAGTIVAVVMRPRVGCRAQIDILVVNCSLFNPTPSLSAMIVNHFKMRSNVISYNLGGMGCSAGVIAIGLAKELLQARRCSPTCNRWPQPMLPPLQAQLWQQEQLEVEMYAGRGSCFRSLPHSC